MMIIFHFLLNNLLMINPTQNENLSLVAKLYDPLGLLSPTVIRFKIFMQSLLVKNLNWDDHLPENLADKWKEVYRELVSVKSLKIPRWLGT